MTLSKMFLGMDGEHEVELRQKKWAAKCFPALSFMETGLNFQYVNQIERYRANLTSPLT